MRSFHFVYCGQLNALEAFAWILWWVLKIVRFFERREQSGLTR